MTLGKSFQTVGPFKDFQLAKQEANLVEKFRELDAANNTVVIPNSSTTIAVGFTQSVLVAVATVNFSAGVGNVDALAYTIPASAAGNGTFVVILLPVRLSNSFGGGGSVSLTCGTTAGANDLMTAQVVSSASVQAIVGGVDIATLGTAFTAADGYQLPMNPGQQIWIRAATTVAGATGGQATLYVYGYALP